MTQGEWVAISESPEARALILKKNWPLRPHYNHTEPKEPIIPSSDVYEKSESSAETVFYFDFVKPEEDKQVRGVFMKAPDCKTFWKHPRN